MKTILSMIFAVALILGFSGIKTVNGQAIAIGHITAEVIESVSASSLAITSLGLNTNSAGIPSTVDLGAITVNSGSSIAVNIVVNSASLADAKGNNFTLDPTVSNSLASASLKSGSQTIELNGTVNLASDQASGVYQGSYTVVFAYN